MPVAGDALAAALAPQHEALRDRACASAPRRSACRPSVITGHRRRRRHRDRRGRDQRRLHRQPSRRARRGWRRSRVALGGRPRRPGRRARRRRGRAWPAPRPQVKAPQRLLEYTGSGTNAWTAAEGALKVRETAYIAHRGALGRAALPRPVRWPCSRATRWWRWTVAARAASACWRSPPAPSASASRRAPRSASTTSASRSRSSRSRWRCSASRSRWRRSSARTPTRSSKDRPGAVDAWGSIAL